MKKLALAAFIIFAVASCTKTKTEVVEVNVNNNVPPPDHTIDSSTLSIYVNKAYINLLGREPSAAEKSSALIILRQNNFAVDRRKEFISTLFLKNEYLRNLYNVANNEYLRNLDSMEIESQFFQFNFLLSQPQYAPFYDFINVELKRLDTLKMIMPNLQNGTMDYKGALMRMTDNYFYDQINMGSENFVVSTYQNFLFRYPSDAELLAGKSMIDGNVSTVFLHTGKSKHDYINIFFNTSDYYEGQVRFIFKKYLFREPSAAEISFFSEIYKTSNDYKELEKAIFTLNEYAGL
jgi:hypothetical protein